MTRREQIHRGRLGYALNPSTVSCSEEFPPAGIRLRPGSNLLVYDQGRLLFGGAPRRVLRLSDTGAKVFSSWLGGEPLTDNPKHRSLARHLLDAGIMHPHVTPINEPNINLEVTVVIPVYNDEAGLTRCLESLHANPEPQGSTAATGPQVIVVDDASDNAAAIAAVCEKYQTKLLRCTQNVGPGAARNAALPHVFTNLVAFVDADVEVSPDWISHLIGHFQDRRVVAVAPRVRSRNGDTSLELYEHHHSPLDLGANPTLVAPDSSVSHVPTAALVARTDAISAISGFAPELRYGEDVDLVWRLIDQVGVVRYDPSVEVTHRPRKSWNALLWQRHHYGYSAGALSVRHGSRLTPLRCSVWSAAVWGTIAKGHLLSACLATVASAIPLQRKLAPLLAQPRSIFLALRIIGATHLRTGFWLARALARVWWPLAFALSLIRPRTRTLILTAMLTPHLFEWLNGARPRGLMRCLALRLLDDFAYGSGVWRGALSARHPAAITPIMRRKSRLAKA